MRIEAYRKPHYIPHIFSVCDFKLSLDVTKTLLLEENSFQIPLVIADTDCVILVRDSFRELHSLHSVLLHYHANIDRYSQVGPFLEPCSNIRMKIHSYEYFMVQA